MENSDLSRKIDEDIDRTRKAWDAYSYDAEKMSAWFRYLISTYKDKIDGFCQGLTVIQPYEDTAMQAEAYRKNIAKLLERLEGFRQNGCQNDGLVDYYLKQEENDAVIDVNFTQLRLEIGLMESISDYEKEEIIEKLEEMEEICAKVLFKRQKWELMREYLVWLSGKDVEIALKILPAFFKINNR